MMAVLGYLTLVLAFLLSIYGLFAICLGLIRKSSPWTESARLSLVIVFFLVTLSLVALSLLLLNQQFDVAYVFSVTSREMAPYLRLTALWGGQSGSLLFWSWLMAAFGFVFGLRKWQKDARLLPWALFVVLVSIAFFLLLNVFMESPFDRFWQMPDGSHVLSALQPVGAEPVIPPDGQGLNPLLRHPGMIWHPPALYLGFIGFIVPFGLAFSSLMVNDGDKRWLEISRPWILFAWIFLTLGLVLGMRWAYDILGWGGYWGWDPVEIAALMPWLSATALIHTAILQQRHQSDHKRWNYALVILTFVMVIFGTFITRSGMLSSVHTFSDSGVGMPMFLYSAILTIGSLAVLIKRWRSLRPENEPQFSFSKETLTLFSNVVLLSILLVCFLGVIFPILSDWVMDTQITVGPAWYKRIVGPLLLLELFLMGISPLAAWHLTQFERLRKHLFVVVPLSLLVPLTMWVFSDINHWLVLLAFWVVGLSILSLVGDYIQQVIKEEKGTTNNFIKSLWAPLKRNHRRYGGMLVHFGVILMSIGIIGMEGLQQELQTNLAIGESVDLGGYTFNFDDLSQFSDDEGRIITEAEISTWRQDKPAGTLFPRRVIYPRMNLAVTEPGLHSNLARDLYVILVDTQPNAQNKITFNLFYNPLVSWLWIGTIVLTLGSIVTIIPGRKENRDL